MPNNVIEIIFWVNLLLLAYAFCGYPIVIWLLSTIATKQTKDDSYLPAVSIILSVYNEELVIKGKIENFLSLQYPSDKLEFVIISDGSSDQTNQIIKRFESERIHLIVQTQRCGKTQSLNRGVEQATGEILVFTDANAMFDRDAVQKMARNFSDPKVALVSGKSIYCSASGAPSSASIYRRFEDFIKRAESAVGGIIGGDGAIYALRKNYYTPLQPQYINDFAHTIQVVLGGGRAISDESAICREQAEEVGNSELGRQTRIMAQSWLMFFSQFGRLLRAGKWVYLWQFISHKFLRWLTLPFLCVLFICCIALIEEALVYKAIFLALLLFLLLIVLGSRASIPMVRFPFLFIIVHYAAVVGLFKYFSGQVYTTWTPRNN